MSVVTHTSVQRVNPDGSTVNIGMTGFTDPFTAEVIKQESIVSTGAPAAYVKIANAVNALAGYPYDGADIGGATPGLGAKVAQGASNGASTIFLDKDALGIATASPLSCLGLALIITSGNAAGECRLFVKGTLGSGWNQADLNTRQALLNAPWVSPKVPAANDTYHIVVPCVRDTQVMCKTEFASAQSNVPTGIDLTFMFYDYGQEPVTGLGRSHVPFADVLSTVQNLNTSYGATSNTWFHGTTISVAAKGGIGFKVVLLRSPEDASNISLWGASS